MKVTKSQPAPSQVYPVGLLDTSVMLRSFIVTPLAEKFFASNHKCNRMKAHAAFSTSVAVYNDRLRSAGYSLGWRNRAIKAYTKYINNPSMTGIPYSELDSKYYIEMPY